MPRGRRWLDELIADPTANAESIAKREMHRAEGHMTISLSRSPHQISSRRRSMGGPPHGMGVARLCDLPVEWSRQRQMLGLIAQ